MKRRFFAVTMISVLGLVGCATLEGNGAADRARRAAFVQAHPNNSYNEAIAAGFVMTGMSRDEVFAAKGDICTIESASDYGYTMRCQTAAQRVANDPGTLVLFDNTDHVTQWVH